MPQFTVKATALVPATTEFNIEAESSSAACAQVRDYLENLSFGASWNVGDTEVELIPDDDIQITGVESLTKDADVAAGMFCSTFDLITHPIEQTPSSSHGVALGISRLFERLRMADSPSPSILAWGYGPEGRPVVEKDGRGRARVQLFGYGASARKAAAALGRALMGGVASSDEDLIASVTQCAVREATPEEKRFVERHLQASGDASAPTPRRRPRM